MFDVVTNDTTRYPSEMNLRDVFIIQNLKPLLKEIRAINIEQ